MNKLLASGFAATMALASCGGMKSGTSLSAEEIQYIKKLGLLTENEQIILFETHSGWPNSVKASGNFISDKRLASYWIDSRNQARTTISSAFYPEIDTIATTNLAGDLTAASYLNIKTKSGRQFNLYISADSSTTVAFFDKALAEWKTRR